MVIAREQRFINPQIGVITGWTVAVFTLVFLLHSDLLATGFYADDFDFLKRVRPFTFSRLPEFFSPHWGWFYRPVYLTYFSVLTAIFGPDPVAFHAASLVLHSVNILLLMGLMYRLSGKSWPALLCGLAFLLYTSKTEAIGWISSASTLLASGFYLLTLHGWLSWRQRPRRITYVGTLLAFILALCSKEDAQSLPFALLIFDCLLCPRETSREAWLRRLKHYAPFVLAAVGYLLLDVIAYLDSRVVQPTSDKLARFVLINRLRIVVQFFNEMCLGIFGLNPLPLTALWMGLVGWAARRDRVLWGLWLWGVATALPVPLAAGMHALQVSSGKYGPPSRFLYLPALAVICFFVAWIVQALSRAKSDERCKEEWFVTVILVSALVGRLASFDALDVRDPVLAWPGTMVLVIAALLAYRARLLELSIIVIAITVLLASQIGPYIIVDAHLLLQIGAAVACAVATARLGRRRDWWQGALAVGLTWPTPLVSLPLVMVGMAGFNSLYDRLHGGLARATPME